MIALRYTRQFRRPPSGRAHDNGVITNQLLFQEPFGISSPRFFALSGNDQTLQETNEEHEPPRWAPNSSKNRGLSCSQAATHQRPLNAHTISKHSSFPTSLFHATHNHDHFGISLKHQAGLFSTHAKKRKDPKSTKSEKTLEKGAVQEEKKTVVSPVHHDANGDPTRSHQILALLEMDEKVATDKGLRLFQQMIREYENIDSDPSVVSSSVEAPDYGLLEQLLDRLVNQSKGDHKATALQAQAIYTDMKNVCGESYATVFTYYRKNIQEELFAHPPLACYYHLIIAWSKANSPDPAERVLGEMLRPEPLKAALAYHQKHKKSQKLVKALLGKSLNQVLSCWAKAAASGHAQAGTRCDALLTRLGRLQFPKDISVKPNPESYHLWLQTWRSATDSGNKRSLLSPKDTGQAARRVQELVNFMTKRYETTNNAEWLPDPDCYGWLIEAHGRAGSPERAQKILELLINNATSGKSKETPAPTTTMYNHVLEAWARKGKGQEAGLMLSKWVSQCQIFYERNKSETSSTNASSICHPDHTSCLLVIRAWGKFSDHYRAPQAEFILRRMQELQMDNVSPKPIVPAPAVETYNAVLQAWSRHCNHKIARAATNAQRILDEMHCHETHNRDNPMTPNARSYELVIEAYARFGYKLPDRRTIVNKLMRQMKHFGVVPSERCLALVELCQTDGTSLEDKEAGEIVVSSPASAVNDT